jgi:hypothetical protein
VFAAEPAMPWSDDPIAQTAIRTCEEIIHERNKIEELEASASHQQIDGPRAWSPIVIEWEAIKIPPKHPLAGPERIPESDIRCILAKQNGAKPDEITEVQIERAAMELCRHYETFQIIPATSNDRPLPDYRALCEAARPDSAFWKEREDEFWKHNTGQNASLGARNLSGHRWTFYVGGDMDSPSADVLWIFKALSREAVKGLGSKRGRESWIDWLELLSCAKDEDTEKRHYSVIEGCSYVPEREFQRTIATGEEIPPGTVIEFGLTSQGTIEKGRRWYTRSPRIENLFAKSEGQCLELWSLVPYAEPTGNVFRHASAASSLAPAGKVDRPPGSGEPLPCVSKTRPGRPQTISDEKKEAALAIRVGRLISGCRCGNLRQEISDPTRSEKRQRYPSALSGEIE